MAQNLIIIKTDILFCGVNFKIIKPENCVITGLAEGRPVIRRENGYRENRIIWYKIV